MRIWYGSSGDADNEYLQKNRGDRSGACVRRDLAEGDHRAVAAGDRPGLAIFRPRFGV